MQTEAAAQPLRGGDTRLWGRCYGRFGLKGAAVAFMAVPAEDSLRVIEVMELAEGLPHPTLDGVWTKQSPAARTSYLFIDMTRFHDETAFLLMPHLTHVTTDF